jgi:oxygen-independent coproporphyrinogen-3 oxidase
MPSLYVHIPFCEKKCLYCDFYSVENVSAMDDFLEALVLEIARYSPYGEARRFDTVFFGGGTPSLLRPEQLQIVLSQLRNRFDILPDAEITLETNPGTADARTLRAYRDLGVNRLSIGIQSFHEDELRFLSRIHDSADAIRCYTGARAAGFDNVSLDLIYSLPGQSPDRWEANLRRAVDLGPDHISAYSLIVEDHTPLSRMVQANLVSPNPSEAEAALYEWTMGFLEARGYEHYEVSNYARPGRRSRHNCAYWAHEDYLGFGPSAHSFWKSAGEPAGRRWWNVANVRTYCERLAEGKLPVASEEGVGGKELINERIFLGLRSDGLNLLQAERDFRFEFQARQHELIRALVTENLAVLQDGLLRLTPRGYLLCDEISERLFV